ncbi:MAG TPA: hypothetical protein VK970_13645, partial [Candidatus Methylacidiphilales bacterium]|nr:hypothetical protein [Candidatus Methylacidiphilales bacterium]
LMVSAFGQDGILITMVGDSELVSEENCVRQSAPTVAKAWRRHSATIAAWERDGQVAARDAKHIWKMASIGIEDAIWTQHFDLFEREAYLQKCAFIALGAVTSLLMGVGLAIWL